MIYPKFIKKGDTIGVATPSNGADDEFKINKYNNAKKRLESLGFKFNISKNINKSYKARSADKITRAKEMNDMFKNKDIDLILCASGGEFMMEILPYIDFDNIKNHPKYLCGFSDPTNLLYPVTTLCDIATIYGSNFTHFGTENLHQSQEDFLDVIKGEKLSIDGYDFYEKERSEKVTGLEDFNLSELVEYKTLDGKDTIIKGRIIGGCFDVINDLLGTKYDGFKNFEKKYKKDGIIWYFDNCNKSYDDTILVLLRFKEFGYFDNCNGIIFGRFANTDSYVGYDTLTCLKESVLGDLNIPVIYDADVSHKYPCLPIINGSIATIKVSNKKCNISFELK